MTKNKKLEKGDPKRNSKKIHALLKSVRMIMKINFIKINDPNFQFFIVQTKENFIFPFFNEI